VKRGKNERCFVDGIFFIAFDFVNHIWKAHVQEEFVGALCALSLVALHRVFVRAAVASF